MKGRLLPPLSYEEKLVATFVASGGIADITSPTVAEVGAGTDYSSYIPKNGITFPSQRNMIDTGSIDRKFNSEYPGSEGGTLEIVLKVQNRDGSSAAWTEFAGGEVEGYWVFGFEGSNDTAADEVAVYHVVGHTPVRNNPGPDEEQRFTVSFGVQEWEQEATVAA